MNDTNYIKLMAARRLVKRTAEGYQNETSKKLVAVPMHAFEELMEATRLILLEELGD